MIVFNFVTSMYSQSTKIDPQWLKLLSNVGVTSEQLKDVQTATFILEFVEKHGGIEEANRQLLEASRSPPGSPARSRTKSVMIRRGKSRRGRGQRPPIEPLRQSPPPLGSNVPAPPPPPPLQSSEPSVHMSEQCHDLLPIDIPAAPPPPSVGVVIAVPPPPPIPTISCDSSPSIASGGARPVCRDLLADIQAGFQLRPVDTSQLEARKKPLTGMAAALANALSMRSKVMQLSGE